MSGSLRLLHPQLADIVFQFEEAQQRLKALEARTTDVQWGTRSRPDSWSIGECIAHLNLTSRAYIPLLRDAFDSDNLIRKPPRRFFMDPIGWVIAKSVGEMPRLGGFRIGRMKTAPKFVPPVVLNRELVVAEFHTHQHELIKLAHWAEQRDLHKLRIASPFNPRISYNAYAALVMLPRHQHRHLAQAERVWGSDGR